jgi:hypothetical protein
MYHRNRGTVCLFRCTVNLAENNLSKLSPDMLDSRTSPLTAGIEGSDQRNQLNLQTNFCNQRLLMLLKALFSVQIGVLSSSETQTY